MHTKCVSECKCNERRIQEGIRSKQFAACHLIQQSPRECSLPNRLKTMSRERTEMDGTEFIK